MADYVETELVEAEQSPHPARRTPGAFRSLRHRDFAIYWIGLIVSTTGSWMQSAAQGWLAYDLTHNKFYLGAVTAAGSLPILFLTLHSGVIADRFSKRKITIITQSFALVQATALAALAYFEMIQPWHLLALAGFMGLVNAFDIPARQAMTSELVGKEDVLNAVALTSSAFNGARIAGPFIAGLIMVAFGASVQGQTHALDRAAMMRGPGACFFINAISYLAVIIGLLIIRPKRLPASSRDVAMRSQIQEGLAYAFKDPVIRGLLLLTAVASIFGLQYTTLMPALAKDVLKIGPDGLGTLMAAAGLGALAAGLFVASIGHRFKPRSIVTVGSIWAPVGLIAVSFISSYPLTIACIVFIGFGMMMFLAVSNSIIQVASPDELRGRILSVRTFVFMGLAPVGALLIGAVAELAGVQKAILYGGIACLASALFFALRPNGSPDSVQ